MKRIGVLTSGGDAPGMNAAIRAVVRSAIYNNMEVYGIRYGYRGLINGDLVNMSLGSVADIIQLGGTILYTARCPEFKTMEGQRAAKDVVRKLNRGLARGKKHSIIVVAEGVMSGAKVGDYIRENTGFDVRVTVLGHIQRGGAPTSRDRILASQLGNYAVELLRNGDSGKMVSVLNGQLHSASLDEVFREKHGIDTSLYQLVDTLAI